MPTSHWFALVFHELDQLLMAASINLAVNGTLMRGLELNPNLHQVGASFIRESQTEPAYRLWSIGDRHPAMVKVTQGGHSIAVEVWAIPAEQVSTLLLMEPAGLCVGKVRLIDGEEVLGILGEPFLVEGQREITQWGGWRAYIAHSATEQQLVTKSREAV